MSGPDGTTHGALATTADPIDEDPAVTDTVLVTGYPPDLVPGDYLRMASMSSAGLRWQEVHHREDVFGTQTKVCFHRPGETRPGRMGAFLLDNDVRIQIARPVAAADYRPGILRRVWNWIRR